MHIIKHILVTCLAFALGAPAVQAQDSGDSTRLVMRSGAESLREDAFVIPRLDGPVGLDGLSDEPAWQEVETLRLIAHAPTYGGEPSEPTEVQIAHDGRHLYVAARMYDSEPSQIQALTLKRNDGNLANDIFALVLDTFNDRETAVSFGTTPTGTRTDLTISNDANAGTDLNFDWNTFWDVAVVHNGEGWFAEYRIPFSSLQFQDVDGKVTMGVSFWRWIPHKEELATYPGRPPRWGFNSILKPSQTQRFVLEGVEGVRPLWVVPYVLGGGDQSHVLNDAATEYGRLSTPAYDIGLDVKYGMTDNLTLDVAVNPDFAQVEADNQQVNLSRYSLFFPEKRRFFQERSSAFDFSLGGDDRLFHSRRIGLVQGEQVRIWGGGRVAGRLGPWDVGALNMQTGASELSPSENFGVGRLRRKVLNENSYFGGIYTSRLGTDGTYNFAFGLDSNIRLYDQDYVTLTWAQTVDDGDRADVLDHAFARARWERRGSEGFGYVFDFSRAGSVFHPGVGYMLRTDYTRFGDRLYYGWRPGGDARIYRHTVTLGGSVYRRNADGSTETAEIGPEWQVETKSGHAFTVGATSAYEDLRAGFPLAVDVDVPAGSYWFHSGRVAYWMPEGWPFRSSISAAAGSFFDGFRTSFSVTPAWVASRHIELSGAYRLDRVNFPDRDQSLNAHIVRARLQLMFSTELSGATFLQYNSAANAVIANIRFRYNPREGTDLYIVYNHGIHTDRHRLEPFLPFTDSRTLLIKYSRALDLGF